MKFLTILLALLVMPTIGFANDKNETPLEAMPVGLYKMDKTHASLTWKVNHLGLSYYTARFTDFDADLYFDSMDVEKSQVRATINVASLETDYPKTEEKDFNNDLKTEAGWFNIAQYPTITFRSTKVEIIDDHHGKMTGDLTFLGMKKPITLDVTLNRNLGNHPFTNKPALGFSAHTTIKRSDFGMTKYIPQVADDVEIIIESEFIYAK